MRFNYKIEYNHTLKEYNSKIKKLTDKHIAITLKEAQEFDIKFGTYTYDKVTKEYSYQFRVLNNRTWWFINDVFYEAPTNSINKITNEIQSKIKRS